MPTLRPLFERAERTPEESLRPLAPVAPGWVARCLIAAIHAYQRLLSPLLGRSCRFEPSCSRYTLQCIELHGAAHGSWLGARRIGRCHPFHPGGFDPPPPRVARGAQALAAPSRSES